MTLEKELWACALEIERQYGNGAFLFASMRIDELEADACWEGAATWRRILHCVQALETSDSRQSH